MRTYFLLLGCIFLFAPTTIAQQRFKAGVKVGLTVAQINGDDSAGFNKIGLMGGIKAATVFSEKSELGLEILYSQRGSQTELTPNNTVDQRKIHLNYVEVPVYFTYMDWEGDDDYYRLHFHAGLSYGRLFGAKLQYDEYDALVNEFNENDISWLAGATYFINSDFGLTLRYTRSLTLLFNNAKVTNVNSNSLLGFFITFNGVYMF